MDNGISNLQVVASGWIKARCVPGALVSNMCPLIEWLRQRGYWVTGKQQQTLTHVFLNGGKANVPPEGLDEFYTLYASVVASGTNSLYAVERTPRGALYRMFSDFDIALPTSEDNGFLHTVLDEAFLHVPSRLCGEAFTLCVRQAHGNKVGAHMVWPGIAVDDTSAIELRNEWVAALPPTRDWDHIIDAAVYKKNGLRMPWSLKRGGDQKSIYVPWRVLKVSNLGTGIDVIDEASPSSFSGSMSTIKAWLLSSSILLSSSSTTPTKVIQATAVVQNTTKRPRSVKKTAALPMSTIDDSTGTMSMGDAECLRNMLPASYASTEFHTVKASEASHIFPCESRMCLTAGRQHTSNRIYFLASSAGGLDQCCFSPSCNGARTRISNERPSFLPPIPAGYSNHERKRKAGGGVGGTPTPKRTKKVVVVSSLRPMSAKAAVTKWTTRG